MDGHGAVGHLVAAFVEQKLPFWLAEEKDLKTCPAISITRAVANLCAELRMVSFYFMLCLDKKLTSVNLFLPDRNISFSFMFNFCI